MGKVGPDYTTTDLDKLNTETESRVSKQPESKITLPNQLKITRKNVENDPA